MRYYVVINGVNSLTKAGLAISALPPISKPMKRTLREEIDGRDGDIITNLGYSAYDKTLMIGLYGESYDINDIIAFFNQSGNIVFSDEPDKYYKFEILEQIDYEKLLKFKQATVTIHCQPFKYPLNEPPLVEEYEYVNGSGTNLTLNNTAEGKFNKIELQGNTYQKTTTGKNLLGLKNGTYTPSNGTTGITAIVLNNKLTIRGTASGANEIDIPLLQPISSSLGTLMKSLNPTGTYTGVQTSLRASNPNTSVGLWSTNGANISGTLSDNAHYFRIQVNDTISVNCTMEAQTELGSTATPFEQFTYGASPNPQFPQPVNVVSGDNEISICGKNLFDGIWEDGTINSTTGENQAGTNVRRTKNFIPIQPNTIYTLSRSNTDNTLPMRYYDKQKNFVGSETGLNGNIRVSFTSPSNAYYVRLVDWANGSQNVMLEKGNQATTYEPYIGNTYPIYLGVENLFDKNNFTELNAKIDSGSIASASAERLIVFKCQPNTTYTFTKLINTPYQRNYIGETTTNPTAGTSVSNTSSHLDTNSFSYTTSANAQYIVWWYYCTGSTAYTKQETLDSIVIEKGSKANHPSATPIELCGIGDYKDKPFKAVNGDETYDSLTDAQKEGLTIGNWYVYKAIGKIVLDGSENWVDRPNFNDCDRFVYEIHLASKAVNGFSNYFKVYTYLTSTVGNLTINAGSQIVLNFSAKGTTTLAQFKTWLGTHNITLYYQLTSPTITQITDENLIAQLEALKQANSYDGQTNITQDNNDLPFILDVSVLEKGSDEMVVNNEGNIYSKPTLYIEGNGVISVYLNSVQAFSIDLSTKHKIVIDTTLLEAYDPDTNDLMNRQVTGDYSKFTLNVGTNIIKFSGDLTQAVLTNYKRWL